MDMHRSKTSNTALERNGEDLSTAMDMDMELPGFRFHPTEDELVSFYLRRRVLAVSNVFQRLINDLDIYKSDPWELPKMARLCEGQTEWYFFCPRDKKYKNSDRPNRVTKSGFWKATGTDKHIHSSTQIIGLKKSLVFYVGKASKGTKTDWMMHEFRLSVPVHGSNEGKCWAICKIYKRKGNASTHCRVPYAEKSALQATPLVASNLNPDNNPVTKMHTKTDYESFHSDDDLKSEDNNDSSLASSPNHETHITVSQSDYERDTSHDESSSAVLMKSLEFIDKPKPEIKKKPVGLKLERNNSMNWPCEFLSPLFTPDFNPSILNSAQTILSNVDHLSNVEDRLFVDHLSNDLHPSSIPNSSMHCVWSPQWNTLIPIWDQPCLFQA